MGEVTLEGSPYRRKWLDDAVGVGGNELSPVDGAGDGLVDKDAALRDIVGARV